MSSAATLHQLTKSGAVTQCSRALQLGACAHDVGQGMPQVVVTPLGQTVGPPAAQVVKLQPGSPGLPPGHSSAHWAPAGQEAEQLWSLQLKRQVLPRPHAQWPLAHSPSHCGLSPAHCT